MKNTHVFICGSRNWEDEKAVVAKIRSLPLSVILVTGGAEGAETMALDEARRIGIPTFVCMHEDWRLRNRTCMKIVSRVIAFHRGDSVGMVETIGDAQDMGLPVELVVAP